MSEKPIAQKLFIRDNDKVLLINEPGEYRKLLGTLPVNVTILTEAAGEVDLAQVFVTAFSELRAQLIKLKTLLKPGGILWVTYPKGTSKIKVDIERDSIREYAQSIGLQAVAMVSIDDTWSALRLKVID